MIHILTIIGARPQIIKAAALSRAIKNKFYDSIEEKILHTGQHYDENMSDVFFSEMDIPLPTYNLNIGSGSHGEQTAKMILGIEQVLIKDHFDAIVVYGDTNSTLAGAIAASKLNIPIVHIEAGLRSFNMTMPEEINRIACDHLSMFLFAPTNTAIENLEKEGFTKNSPTFKGGQKRFIYNSGDIMYDNFLHFASIAEKECDIIQRLGLQRDEYILTTIHRDSNTDDPIRLSSIFEAILKIASDYNMKFVIPIHPRTKKMLPKNLPEDLYNRILSCENIRIIPPASFFEIIELERNARIIMTDSGGVQKEAYFSKKPSIILRPETEWVEIIEQRAGILCDADSSCIIEAFKVLNYIDHKFPAIFGNGNSAEFILSKIMIHLSV